MDSTVELDSFLSRSFLDLEKIDENLFRSKSLWKHKTARGVYGGQTIGQALVAASQNIPENQHIHSLHSYFLKEGKEDVPILFHVDKTRDGRTYCARSVKAVQAGAVMFTMQASFKQEEPISTVHQLTMPKVPHPDELETATEVLERFRKDHNLSEAHYSLGREWYDHFPATIKFLEPDQLLLQKTYYPRRHVWIKAKGHIGNNLHQNTHKCCLAYLSDSFILPTTLMRLAPIQNRPSLFYTSLDHSMWFHAACRGDQWLLYELETEHIGDGRAMCRGRVWDLDGRLVITMAQEGVMRHKETPSKL
jgi:acyl-CoA thioesterase 8